MELELLDGRLAVRDLPETWRERYSSDLGVEPPDDRDGVLQDVHWFHGTVGGAFQGYTLGNLISAQVFAAARRALPDLRERIRRGDLTTLHDWLRHSIYRHGRVFTASELVQRVTGAPIGVDALMGHLSRKYGEIYGLA